MKSFKILATVLALSLSASAFAHGRYHGDYVGNVSPVGNYNYHRGHSDGDVIGALILGGIAGAVIANQNQPVYQQPVYQQPTVVYQQPQPQVVYEKPVYVSTNVVWNGIEFAQTPYACRYRNGRWFSINGQPVHYCPVN